VPYLKHWAHLLCVVGSGCGDDLRLGLGPSVEPLPDASYGTPDDITELQWPDYEPLPVGFDFPPWLTMPAPGRIVVGWRTTDPTTARVRLIRGNDQWVFESSERKHLHHVDLGVLEPGAIYRYEVILDRTLARREGVFVTPGAQRVRLAHMAEFHAPTDSVHVARFTEAIRSFQPHVLVESGDMADSGGSLDHWRDYMRTSAPWISNVILLPAHSNHVNGFGGNEHLRDLFPLPNNGRWYSTRFGPVEIISIDSTYDRDNPDVPFEQIDWLATRAADAHDGLDDPSFLLATWHYPACSSHYRFRATAREWVMNHFIDTLVANGGVDMVLVGHDKYYERSLIDQRIVHLQTNAGRLAPSSAGDNQARCTPIRTNTATRSLALIDLGTDSLTTVVVDESGGEIDRFAIDRSVLESPR